MRVRFMWPYVSLRSAYPLVSIPLIVGNLNIKPKGNMLFSERYGLIRSFVVGPLRISWVWYR